MVDAAAKAYFLTHRAPDGETWADLLETLNGFSERRNDIAHGSVDVTVDFTEKKVRGFFLFPGLYVSKKFQLASRPDTNSPPIM